jgi:hypothetical protein
VAPCHIALVEARREVEGSASQPSEEGPVTMRRRGLERIALIIGYDIALSVDQYVQIMIRV